MTEIQYNFSNSFWNDEDWIDSLPKEHVVDNNDDIEFLYLNKDELKEFIKIKCNKDPKFKNQIRHKKMKRLIRYSFLLN